MVYIISKVQSQISLAMHGNMHISLPPYHVIYIIFIYNKYYIYMIYSGYFYWSWCCLWNWTRFLSMTEQGLSSEPIREDNMQHLSLAMTSSSVIDRKLILKQCLYIFSKTLRNKSRLNFNEHQKDLGHENTIQRWSFENCTILSFTWTNVIFIYLILEITFHVYMVWIIKITPSPLLYENTVNLGSTELKLNPNANTINHIEYGSGAYNTEFGLNISDVTASQRWSGLHLITCLESCWFTGNQFLFPLWVLLTHWPLDEFNIIETSNSQTSFSYSGWGIFCETAIRLMSLDPTGNKLTLVQVITWCLKPLPEPMLIQIYVTMWHP